MNARYARTQNRLRIFKEMQMEVSGGQKRSKSIYVQTLLGHPNLLRKAFLVGQKMSASLILRE